MTHNFVKGRAVKIGGLEYIYMGPGPKALYRSFVVKRFTSVSADFSIPVSEGGFADETHFTYHTVKTDKRPTSPEKKFTGKQLELVEKAIADGAVEPDERLDGDMAVADDSNSGSSSSSDSVRKPTPDAPIFTGPDTIDEYFKLLNLWHQAYQKTILNKGDLLYKVASGVKDQDCKNKLLAETPGNFEDIKKCIAEFVFPAKCLKIYHDFLNLVHVKSDRSNVAAAQNKFQQLAEKVEGLDLKDVLGMLYLHSFSDGLADFELEAITRGLDGKYSLNVITELKKTLISRFQAPQNQQLLYAKGKGVDRTKIECYSCHKMGRYANDCWAPKKAPQEKGKKGGGKGKNGKGKGGKGDTAIILEEVESEKVEPQ